MSEMNKCQNCGTFVPAEKAFCPNCSEPMEPEETPNRAHSFSSDMLATIRDDPEKYRQMLMPPVKKQEDQPAAAQTPEPASVPAQNPASPSATGYSYPQTPRAPTSPAKSGGKSYLMFGIIAVVILVLLLVILYALKVV